MLNCAIQSVGCFGMSVSPCAVFKLIVVWIVSLVIAAALGSFS